MIKIKARCTECDYIYTQEEVKEMLSVDLKVKGAVDCTMDIWDTESCPYCSQSDKAEGMIDFLGMFKKHHNLKRGSRFSLSYKGSFVGMPPYEFRMMDDGYIQELTPKGEWTSIGSKWLRGILYGKYKLVKLDG